MEIIKLVIFLNYGNEWFYYSQSSQSKSFHSQLVIIYKNKD